MGWTFRTFARRQTGDEFLLDTVRELCKGLTAPTLADSPDGFEFVVIASSRIRVRPVRARGKEGGGVGDASLAHFIEHFPL